MAIGMNEDISIIAHRMVIALIPSALFFSINESMKVYLVALKYLKPFLWMNLTFIIFYPVAGYLLIWKCG